MVVGVSLQLEQQVIGESVGSIPAVPDGDFFVLAAGQFVPPESVVFQVIDGF